ncbi:MAG: response regulator transcription factor [Anaerolineales bacterium]|nr:response regulator transcription factor [Anaerolineales bacterium]
MTRILVASPFPLMRAGIRALLEERAPREILVAGEADSIEAIVEWLRTVRPQALLYDLALETDDELAGLWRLRREAPGVPVLALADPNQNSRMLAALQAGARGCLPKTVTAAELTEALQDVAAGDVVVPPTATAALLDQLRGEGVPINLSPREADVLRGVAAGQTNKAIAVKLGISEHTVKFHLGGAMTKLGAASRAEAVASAIRRGLISV